jgi:predicted phage tail protein
MVHVRLTSHLFQFFPDLEGRELDLEARTVAEVVAALEELAPGIAFYVCDERGRLRQHVNVFIGRDPVTDRTTLTDPLEPSSRVHILQALSGG